MADNYLDFSETLDALTIEEVEWLKCQLAEDPDTGCPAFLLDCEDRDPDDTDLGFAYRFEESANESHLSIYAEAYGNVDRVAHLIQKFLKRFRSDQHWSLAYAYTCSKPRAGEFGGGALFVTAEAIKWESSHDFIERERAAFEGKKAEVKLSDEARRWVLSSIDMDRLLTTQVYETYQEAADASGQFNDVLLLPLSCRSVTT